MASLAYSYPSDPRNLWHIHILSLFQIRLKISAYSRQHILHKDKQCVIYLYPFPWHDAVVYFVLYAVLLPSCEEFDTDGVGCSPLVIHIDHGPIFCHREPPYWTDWSLSALHSTCLLCCVMNSVLTAEVDWLDTHNSRDRIPRCNQARYIYPFVGHYCPNTRLWLWNALSRHVVRSPSPRIG